ncbi:MAG: A/G-specific adenine glycosylase [Ardenticatenaceae bacterium]|nr:A/G-specific adenine glycosylase [Ardenticatenaceae bacterium]
MSSPITAAWTDALHERLLAWYAGQARDLPWRRTTDPYAIWVSEIMLQQTQVERVKEYFERWMARFPTVEALAQAPLDEVLKLWEGLGYYARARNLHRAARQLVAEHGGRLPNTVEGLLALPGIGHYTAGAIASIAYGRPVAALDGNLKRVLARLTGLESPINTPAGERALWEVAEALVPDERAGDWNQALMDLGATLCVPQAPRCLLCPLQGLCLAQREGRQDGLPLRAAPRARPHYQVTAGLIWNERGELLIARRPLDKMLGGLWEFPGGKCEDGEALAACLHRELREELGIEVEVGERLTVVEHGYTHFSITLHAFHCWHRAGEPRAVGVADCRWVRPADLDAFAWPRTDRQIITALRERLTAGERPYESRKTEERDTTGGSGARS